MPNPERVQINENPFYGQDFISIYQLGRREEIEYLFRVADQMEAVVRSKETGSQLTDSTIAILFYQPSTRTFTSFLAAAKWLGCDRTVAIPGMDAYSSTTKGESLPDTIKTIEETTAADLIVLRHPDDDSAEMAAQVAQVPVVNAGAGTKEHPTQAILDLYTIQKELGRVDNLHVVMVGDLRYGRTVKSLSLLLALVDRGTKLTLVSPPLLQMPYDVTDSLIKCGVKLEESQKLTKDILTEADVLYVTRLQKEWFEKEGQMDLYRKFAGSYDITPTTLKQANPNMIIMHPLPRVTEIDPFVDFDSRAAYFRQMRNGLYTRMALLAVILGKV